MYRCMLIISSDSCTLFENAKLRQEKDKISLETGWASLSFWHWSPLLPWDGRYQLRNALGALGPRLQMKQRQESLELSCHATLECARTTPAPALATPAMSGAVTAEKPDKGRQGQEEISEQVSNVI